MSIFKTVTTTVKLVRNVTVATIVYSDSALTVYANGLQSPVLKDFAALTFSEVKSVSKAKGEEHGQVAVDFTNNYVIEPTKEFVNDMFSDDNKPVAKFSTAGYPSFA